MLKLTDDILDTGMTQQCPKTGRWLPAVPLPYYPEWPGRIRDAWAVLRGRAEAVQWPEQEK